MIERERTFLLKELPKDLKEHPKKEIIDLYIPKSKEHPVLRIRKSGDTMEITKKTDIEGQSADHKLEVTIPLEKAEYNVLMRSEGKLVSKIRYDYPYNGRNVEIAVFQGDLFGLVTADVEFEESEISAMNQFQMPPFCLADITEEGVFAGGMLAGKRYDEIKKYLDKYHYRPIFF